MEVPGVGGRGIGAGRRQSRGRGRGGQAKGSLLDVSVELNGQSTLNCSYVHLICSVVAL